MSSTSRYWKVVGVVSLFVAGLVVSGAMRFYNLHTDPKRTVAKVISSN